MTSFLVAAAAALGLAAAAAAGPPPLGVISPDPSFNAADPENILLLDLSTGGRVTILLRPDFAPAHVERVKTLVRQGFYDGLVFHRVIDGFMAQTGDPQATGQGGSSLPNLKAEFNDLPHVRGAVSMARTEDPDSANSQFFITFQPVLRLDRNYTVFGRVLDGMEHVDAIRRGEPPAEPSRIVQASIAADARAEPDWASVTERPAQPQAALDQAAAAPRAMAGNPR